MNFLHQLTQYKLPEPTGFLLPENTAACQVTRNKQSFAKAALCPTFFSKMAGCNHAIKSN
jgi:hypothetical protein